MSIFFVSFSFMYNEPRIIRFTQIRYCFILLKTAFLTIIKWLQQSLVRCRVIVQYNFFSSTPNMWTYLHLYKMSCVFHEVPSIWSVELNTFPALWEFWKYSILCLYDSCISLIVILCLSCGVILCMWNLAFKESRWPLCRSLELFEYFPLCQYSAFQILAL